jgi:hypothetical protein
MKKDQGPILPNFFLVIVFSFLLSSLALHCICIIFNVETQALTIEVIRENCIKEEKQRLVGLTSGSIDIYLS